MKNFKLGASIVGGIFLVLIISLSLLDAGVGNTKVLQAQRRGLNAQLTATYR